MSFKPSLSISSIIQHYIWHPCGWILLTECCPALDISKSVIIKLSWWFCLLRWPCPSVWSVSAVSNIATLCFTYVIITDILLLSALILWPLLCAHLCVCVCVRACTLPNVCEEKNVWNLFHPSSKLVVKLTSQIIPLKCVGKTSNLHSLPPAPLHQIWSLSHALFKHSVLPHQCESSWSCISCLPLYYNVFFFLFSLWLKWCLCIIFSSIIESGRIQFYFIPICLC